MDYIMQTVRHRTWILVAGVQSLEFTAMSVQHRVYSRSVKYGMQKIEYEEENI